MAGKGVNLVSRTLQWRIGEPYLGICKKSLEWAENKEVKVFQLCKEYGTYRKEVGYGIIVGLARAWGERLMRDTHGAPRKKPTNASAAQAESHGSFSQMDKHKQLDISPERGNLGSAGRRGG